MVLYEDGVRVVIATTGSSNRKTGAMAQIWILYKHASPTEAVKSGEDYAVCGNCRHREFKSCYVNVGHAPLQVYNAWKTGKYKQAKPRELMAEDVRFGAYGDPAFIPTPLIKEIAKYANSWTGYTHLWKTCDQELKNYFMASVDTEEEYKLAKHMGWTTFRTILPKDQLFLQEAMCPWPIVTCKQCKKCDTHTTDIAVEVHGTSAKINNYKKLRGISIDVCQKTA